MILMNACYEISLRYVDSSDFITESILSVCVSWYALNVSLLHYLSMLELAFCLLESGLFSMVVAESRFFGTDAFYVISWASSSRSGSSGSDFRSCIN